MSHQPLQVRHTRPHPHLGSAVSQIERALGAVRRGGSRAAERAQRRLRQWENRLRNPGPPLEQRGDWYKIEPIEMSPERQTAIEGLRQAQRDTVA